MLRRADPSRAGGFRSFLYGVIRMVALRLETRRARDRQQQPARDLDLNAIAVAEDSLAQAFDRAWAQALVREAAEVQAEHARRNGPAALRRVELLHLRFHDGPPIREIAARWQIDPAQVHHDYARARQEFKAALLEVMAFHCPGPAAHVERECAELITLLE